jgi:predicted SnoaL-like aldol condensation-catalyzing enzyme
MLGKTENIHGVKGGGTMHDPKKNKALVAAFCAAVFVDHDLGGIDRFLRDDYIQHNPDVAQGKAGFKEFFEITFRAMPDFRYTVRRIVADEDLVFVHSTTTATHTGGAWLDEPPTGNKLEFDVVDMFRIEDGLIAEHWDVADTLSLFTQLGKVKG